MLRGNRQKLSVYRAGRIIAVAELLQPLGYTPTPCGIFAVTIYESPTPVMPRYCPAKTTLSPSGLSFISRVKEFVRWAREKLDPNISIIRNRLGSGKTTKVVPTKAEITERLAQGLAFVQITQLKAKNVGRRIASLNWKENWKETTVLIVLILAALVSGYFWPSDRVSENAAQEKKQ